VSAQSLLLADAWADPRFDRSVDDRTGYRTRSMLCVPLISSTGETVGVIQVINKLQGDFDEDDLSFLEAMAAPLAIAIENANLFAENQRQFHSMVEAMAASMDARDPMTAGHSVLTVERAMAIGRELGLSVDDLDLLHIATALHDHGMLGVDDAVLRKAGPLDVRERDHMERHAGLTEGILRRIHLARRFRQLPTIAAAHHEAMDGSGYPLGLRGNEIPFLSRIIAVADTYEAMTAERPYRAAQSAQEVWTHIERHSGTRFDPVVVAALRRVLDAQETAT
jgi:HD-GYP domain-containing protein (c-di-GMP phosphodiesterase class II)